MMGERLSYSREFAQLPMEGLCRKDVEIGTSNVFLQGTVRITILFFNSASHDSDITV